MRCATVPRPESAVTSWARSSVLVVFIGIGTILLILVILIVIGVLR